MAKLARDGYDRNAMALSLLSFLVVKITQGRIIRDALEPSDALLESRLGVRKRHRSADLFAKLIDSTDYVVYLGDIHTCVEHMNLPVFVFGGAAAFSIQDRNLPKETRSRREAPSSS